MMASAETPHIDRHISGPTAASRKMVDIYVWMAADNARNIVTHKLN